MLNNPKVDTALHILKGAVIKVLGATVTTGVYQNEDNGRLNVEFSRKPEPDELIQIEEAANSKIAQNSSITVIGIDRDEAEEKFGKIIYDKFPVPEHIKNLKLLIIDDWNINCCIGSHLKSTGELSEIKILKSDFRNSRQQLEISFIVS